MGDFSLDYKSQDDEEKDRLLRDFLSSSQPDAPPPQTQAEATGRAAQAEPDELEQALKQHALESMRTGQQAPTQRAMASGPDITAGIGPAAGIILDAFVNHGRGAGQIVGAAANSMSEDRRAEQTRLDHLAEIEARRKDKDPMAALVGYGNLKARNFEDEEVKKRNVDLRAAAQQAQLNPDSAEAKGKSQTIYDQSASRKRGNMDVAHELNDRTGDDRAENLGKGQQAIADVKHGNAPRVSQDKAADIEITTPAAAGKAGAVADAQLPAKERAQQSAYDIAHPGTGGDLVAIPGSVIDDPNVYRSFRGNPTQLQKLTDAVGGAQALDKSVSEMKRIRGDVGIEALKSGDKSEYETHYGNAIGALTQLYKSGVLNKDEYDRYKEQLPTLDPHISDATDWFGALVGGDKKDTVADELGGFQKGTRELAHARIRSYGIHPDYGDEPSAPLGAKAAAPAPLAAGTPDAGDTLPVTGGRGVKGTPGLPSDATADPPRHVTVTFPDGVTETHELTEGQIAHLLSRAPKGTEVH